MIESFGATLRALREQRGLSLAALATRCSFAKSYLGNVETGDRPATPALAEALDRVLDSTPLLAVLVSLQRGDPMLRRALLGGGLGAAALVATDGTAAVAAVLDAGLRTAAGGVTDWDTLAADFTRRHLLAPSPAFGAELAAHIELARERVAAGDKDAARGGALLALTYGLWIGDTGRIPTAHSLYATAAALADRSEDVPTRALVRARAANRGLYEGWTAAQAGQALTTALGLYPCGQAGLEAHAARVHLHALTGNLTQGRIVLGQMADVAADMPEATGPSADQRVASFRIYLESRAGTIADTERAWAAGEQLLHAVPLWRADAEIYYGRALAAAGNVTEGARLALAAVETVPALPRVLSIGVRDLLDAAGPAATGDEIEQLRGYAARGVMPWHTIR